MALIVTLEIAPQLLRHAQRHHRRRLGAQYTWAQSRGVEAGALGLFDDLAIQRLTVEEAL